jgi:hypothetical protein
MDPSVKIAKIAVPIIVESERRRISDSATRFLNLEKIKDKLKLPFGRNNANDN